MRHKHAEHIIAFANGEKVEWTFQGRSWSTVDDFGCFDIEDCDYRIAPKTMRIGNRDVPVPTVDDLHCAVEYGIYHGNGILQSISFATSADRTAFWDALVAAVKEAT